MRMRIDRFRTPTLALAAFAFLLTGCFSGGKYNAASPDGWQSAVFLSQEVGQWSYRVAGSTVPGVRDDAGRIASEAGSEDLWIISRRRREAEAVGEILHQTELVELEQLDVEASTMDDAPAPTEGELRASIPGGAPGAEREIPLPLQHTEVSARISAWVASVDVEQKYRNPYAEKIEAVYVFPLPENAAVTGFIMQIGDRRIRAIIREREEAERIYRDARARGHVASLLTQERPNLFTQSVANIEPGKEIDIRITYFHTLRYDDGSFEFVFPMVVGPRYISGAQTSGDHAQGRAPPTDAVPDAPRVTPPVLKPGTRSGHDIAMTVALDAGIPVGEIASPTHAVDVERDGETRAIVRLRAGDDIPNRDFVLRYRVAGDAPRYAMLTRRDEDGGTFALLAVPPSDLEGLPRTPREMIFVIDCSGSMNGYPIQHAKAAVRRCLRSLDPADTFQVISFSNTATLLGAHPLPATPDNIRRGLSYVDALDGGGGTEMLSGIRAALRFPHDPEKLRIVAFLTDGYIGNEMQIFDEIRANIGAARIFSFGVGTSVNRYLLEGMARMGRGAVAYVGMGGDDAGAVDAFYTRAAHAAMTDLSIDWGAMRVERTYPSSLPDLFVGRPVLVLGRFSGEGRTTVRIMGRVGERRTEVPVLVDLDDAGGSHDALTLLWARSRISDLTDQMTASEAGELAREIRDTALRYGLASSYTGFVAVDSLSETADGHGTTVAQPLPMPEGVRYETAVGGE